MKTKIAAVLLAAAALLTNACEQHKWSETKALFKDEHSEHGKVEGTEAHKAEATHGEAKAAAAKEH